MTEVTPTTEQGTQTPTAPSAAPSNGQQPAAGQGGNEPMIPKHRLDEESAKRQAAEDRAIAAEKVAKEAAESSKAVNDKLSNLATALAGGDLNQKQVDAEVAKLATKFNVPEEFVTDMLSIAEQRVSRKFEPDLKAAKLQQAEAAFNNELSSLEKEVDGARDMTPEERAELKTRAISKEFRSTPLKSIYRDMMFDKPRGKSHTAEPGRGGGKNFSDGEPDISTMDVSTPEGRAAFEKFSEGMAQQGK